MTETTSDTATLLRALDEIAANTNRLVAGVSDASWDAPTPCADWTVRQLADHIASSANVLAAAAARTTPGTAPDADRSGEDPRAAVRTATGAVNVAWRSDGALDGSITAPFEMPAIVGLAITVLDLGIHCWDLAAATGQDHGLTPDQITLIDSWSRKVITDDARQGGAFAPVLAGADAGGLTGMLAFTGRQG